MMVVEGIKKSLRENGIEKILKEWDKIRNIERENGKKKISETEKRRVRKKRKICF